MADKTEKKSKGFFAGVKRFFGRIGKFFRDTVSEMKKVVWPSKKQIINNTVVWLSWWLWPRYSSWSWTLCSASG